MIKNADSIEKNGHFLALTAQEEFWDTSKPIIFLRKACLRFSRRHIWQDLKHTVGEDPFHEREALKSAQKYVDSLHEELLPILAKQLNKIHDVEYDLRYWRIILGLWLHKYISILYDRYVSLQKVLEKHPSVDTIGLDESAYQIACNFEDYINLLKDDLYNLQLYSKILSYQKIKFRKKFYLVSLYQVGNRKSSFKSQLLSSAKKIFNFIVRCFSNSSSILLINDGHISFQMLLKFCFKSKGKLLPYFLDNYRDYQKTNTNATMRKMLGKIVFGKNEFEKMLIILLSYEMPHAFLEQYASIKRKAFSFYPKKIKAVLSINAWAHAETFKLWLSQVAAQGTALIGGQHGGNYGLDDYFISEDHELKIFDKYITWGWSRETEKKNHIVPLSVSKLLGVKMEQSYKSNEEILWLMTFRMRYREYFTKGCSDDFYQYLDWQKQFYHALSSAVAAEIIARPHAGDYGWDIKERLLSFAPDMRFKGETKIPFYDALRQCKLFICDNLNTTYLEALALNVPTILFWSPDSIELRSEAVPYFNKLVEAGILHYSPESAAKTVNEIVDNVDSWWHDPMRQNARKYFCDQYGRNDPDSFQKWLDFLMSI